MPTPPKPLTDAAVRAARPPATGTVDIADVRQPGLFLRVTANGVKAWTFRFTDPAGQRARMTLAKYPDLSLADARERADELRRMVAKGVNPIEHRRQVRTEASTKTFAALSDRYLAEHARRFKKSADADERNLRLHVLPKWGERTYASVTRADIIELIEGLIADDKAVLANRVQSLISKIFSFAVDTALISANPATRLKKRGKETANSRVLANAEIGLFWSRIMQPPVSPATGLALKLLLLTGMRPGEAAGLHRRELVALDDVDSAAILLPGERTKNGRAHFLPLSPMARQVVLDAQAMSDSEYLFPARHDDGAPIDPHALARAMARFAADLEGEGTETWTASPPTPHDLRRTLATRLSEAGIAAEDIEAVLNHTRAGVTKRHYDMYQRSREKRVALNLWAVVLGEILGGASNVVPMRRRS